MRNEATSSRRLEVLYWAGWVLVAVFFLARFVHLGADFTTDRSYSGDGVLYTDEGWYSANAIALHRLGHWYRPNELNFAVNLPVLQVLHAASFAVLGVNIAAARTTIILCLLATLALMFLLVRRYEDRWAALIAVLWVASNYFFFLHSRFALAEIPMMMFATASLLLASYSGSPRGWWFAAGAGIAFALSFYTKSSAVFAFPLMLAAVFLAPGSWRNGLAKAGVAAGAFALCFLLHFLVLARPYWADYTYFHTLNVGANARLEAGLAVENFFRLLDRIILVDKVGYQAMWAAIPLALIFSPNYRRHPLLWFSIAWIAIYLAMFGVYANLRPRYWAALAVPMGTIIGVTARHFVRVGAGWRPGAVAAGILGILLVLGVLRNTRDTLRYLGDPRYTFAEMAAEVKRTLDADPDSRGILLGHFATTFALYEEILPVNDRFAPVPLEVRLAEYDPRYLVTESTREERDYANQWATITSAEGGLREKALRARYDRIELIQQFDVFDNYKDWPVSLYRLGKAGNGELGMGNGPTP